MTNDLFFNDRLFGSLKVSGGRRQFVLSGEIEDYFMVDAVWGLNNLENALKIYLKKRGFEVVVFLKSLDKPEFPTPEMERRFNEIVRRESVDPRAAGRTTRTFVPRKNRGADGNSAESPLASVETTRFNGSTEAAENASRTAADVASSGVQSEQAFLDLLTRLFESSTKSAVVFFHPEKMWTLNAPTANDLRKLETVLRWATIANGNPESASILVVNPNRFNEFERLADSLLDRENFTRNVVLSKPGKREIEAFLTRFACRYDYWGRHDKIAATACAKGFGLYNFSEKLREYVKNNSETKSLDGLFADASQVKTLQELTTEIESMVGLESIKEEVRKIVANASFERERRRLGQETEPLNYHMFFLGNPGTGKTTVARLLGQLFWALELRSTQAFVEITFSDVVSSYNEGETVENMRDKIREAAGGVLFVDEFYLFAESDWGRKALDVLLTEMENNRDDLTVILAGYEERLPEFYNVNPGFKTRVNRKIVFEDYRADELFAIFERLSAKENLSLSDDAKIKLRRYFETFEKRGGVGNGRGVRNLFEKAKESRASRRADDSKISASDLTDPPIFREDEARAVIKRLEENYIGLPRVKKFFSDMFDRGRACEIQGETISGMNNCLFLGNPGTGKTSVAREMGRLFYALGMIGEKDKLLEIDPIADLTSQYAGGFAERVRDAFDRALGGVLFIDEAYQLAKDEQGRRVLDQIVKRLTEPAYANLVVVMAGYPDEMRELLDVNVGLKRRFPHEVVFDDFSPEDLRRIFYRLIERDGKRVAPDEKDAFDVRLLAVLARKAAARRFGNAGTVETYYRDEVKTAQAKRLFANPDADKGTLTVADLNGGDSGKTESLDDVLAELNEKFIGMKPLKDRLNSLARRIYVDKKRAEAGGRGGPAVAPGRYNMRFVGSPGTGKTTIARYMARVFCALGIVENPRVREYRGVDLKGSYLGQTKDKVNKTFADAEGSVVLIDEIYGLYDPASGPVDSYGQEAVDALVGNITDPRNATTVVIIAGYKDKTDAFLNANPGLLSRFATEVAFPDYTDDECAQILFRLMDGEGLIYPKEPEFERKAVAWFGALRRAAGENFGNARTVGAAFEQMKDAQAARVCRSVDPAAEDWLTILAEDVPTY